MKKGTKLFGILNGKCPKCQEGIIFKSKNPYDLSSMFAINGNCSCCNMSFDPEPEFYTGALFVSYAFSVAIVISVFVVSNILFDSPNLYYMIAAGIGIAFLFAPMNIRLSRMIWISIFYKYDPTLANKMECGK